MEQLLLFPENDTRPGDAKMAREAKPLIEPTNLAAAVDSKFFDYLRRTFRLHDDQLCAILDLAEAAWIQTDRGPATKTRVRKYLYVYTRNMAFQLDRSTDYKKRRATRGPTRDEAKEIMIALSKGKS